MICPTCNGAKKVHTGSSTDPDGTVWENIRDCGTCNGEGKIPGPPEWDKKET